MAIRGCALKFDSERARSRSLGEETSMKANSEKTKQSNKATRRVLAGVLCGASVLSLVLSLVMPPISQAIANDAQTFSTEENVMWGSSSESTGVDNTGGDAENQNSDAIEDGDADPSNGVEQGQSGDQSDGKLQAEDSEPADDVAVALAAEGGQTETASDEIDSAEKLKSELEKADGAANFKLVKDIDTSEIIQLSKDGSNITLDLNGHKIKHKSSNQPLFNITGGATLTVKDGQKVAVAETTTTQTNKCGNLASMEYVAQIPTSLTYYVTESTASGTSTAETLKAYTADIAGAIVACGGNSDLKLINLYNNNGKGGTFKLESGVITQQQGGSVRSLVYAQDGSTVAMGGGYICGASGSGAGGGIEVRNNSNLNISGGVIAGNSAPSGGGVFAGGSVVTVTNGIISGNSTLANTSGFGGGIMGEGSSITVSGGYVTNNAYQYDYKAQNTSGDHNGNGCHGGGGIAALSSSKGQKNGSLAINGGYITGNYSAEAGGGIYAGAWNQALSTFTFSGGTIASNVAQNSEGGGIRIAAPTVGEFNVSGTKAYITNNTTNTTNDWGGGGVFVQGGNSGENVDSASLKIYNALITNNHAEGFGGGFAACPSGKTAITDTNGIATYGNTDSDGEHRSGGTNNKSEDWNTDRTGGEITQDFINRGHKDLFLIRSKSNDSYIAAVTGQMLGGGAANWSGTIDNTQTSIGKYEGAQAKYMIGLEANPSSDDQELAVSNAMLFITGNSSNIHGGGIMTNGDVIAGSTQEVKVYPKMKLNGTKALEGRKLKNGEFKFQLLKQNKITNENGETSYTVPSFDSNRTLQLNGCTKVSDGVTNDSDGNFAFNLGEVYSDGSIVYYLVEDPGDKPVSGVTCDETIYKIEFVTQEAKTQKVLDITYTYYTVSNVTVTNLAKGQSNPITPPNGSDVSIKITEGNTFTNTYAATGSWTPQVTKKVDGGEMKAFTLELANDENFTNLETVTIDPAKATTDENGNATSTVNFKPKNYELQDLENGSKTFTYYVREKNESLTYPHYKFDQSVYEIKVVATDNAKGAIDCKVTYKQIKDTDGNAVTDTDHDLTDTDTPTFTNTYSTSLPLSGMSGVTLTYLAGAAVLCAAAAWMHIRRKANAKGGERRE